MLTGQPVPEVQAALASDAELIAGSLRQPDCFAAIFDRHGDAILRFACARLGPDIGEEVTAETFLAAFGRRGAYDRSYADARPWLYGIAVRQIGKHRRAEARQRQLLASMPAELVAEDLGDRIADQVTAQQLRPRLVECLSGLPRRDLLLTAPQIFARYGQRAADAIVSSPGHADLPPGPLTNRPRQGLADEDRPIYRM